MVLKLIIKTIELLKFVFIKTYKINKVLIGTKTSWIHLYIDILMYFLVKFSWKTGISYYFHNLNITSYLFLIYYFKHV